MVIDRPVRQGLPKGVWALGLVSLLADISSEMVSGLLPVFLVSVVGVSAAMVGLIEGVATASTMLIKVVSGGWSDAIGKRKPFVLGGYVLSACAKPILAIATGFGLIATARIVDRIGKGVRDAPRDALISDITPEQSRGAAFGLRQALDTAGAFIGPLLAMGLMLVFANNYQMVFWLATIPAVLAAMLVWIGVDEPARNRLLTLGNLLSTADLKSLGGHFWWLVLIGATFTSARFSEAFLILRAQNDGLPLAMTPLVLIAMNVVYASLAYPFGKLSDSGNRQALLFASLVVLIAADLLLAAGGWGIWAGIALWGLHLAMAQGLISAMLANAAPPEMRGTAFGLYYLVSGIALLLASTAAGLLWDSLGPAAPFLAGAGICLLALLLLWSQPGVFRRKS